MLKIRTEIYSRVSGYYRPVSQWNKGKQEEYGERRKMKHDEPDYSASGRDFNTRRDSDAYKKTSDVLS